MKVTLKNDSFLFLPWRPEMGHVFRRPFAFDCETTLINRERPWITPAYVLGAAFDGDTGYFVRREHAAAFFEAHREKAVVFHNAAFDLAVIHTLAPKIDIYGRVDNNLVWDTQLLHRLYVLGTEGHTAGGKGESDLEHCADLHLKIRLPKDVEDSAGDMIRLSYGKWLARPPAEIEPVYLEYLARDVIVTRRIYRKLRKQLGDLLARSDRVWGFVSDGWLAEQVGRWGEQTHHIQLRAGIVLKEIGANGLYLDVGRRAALLQFLEAELDRLRKALREFGHLPGGEGANKSLQAVLKRLARDHPGRDFPRTETGQYATAHDALLELADVVPFAKLLLEYRAIEKLLGSFVNRMGKRALHPSFNVLARSGRTSSFGEINAQNLPTDDRVRSCFVPSPGHVFIDADYRTIEMATLAQACLAQFGLDSKMAGAINAGKDLHRVVAARVTLKAEDEVTDQERKKAKPINFGKPGGMGDATLKEYARTTYGVRLDDEDVRALSEAWLGEFPEMREFLADCVDTGEEVARLLGLTPASHREHTGDSRFLNHPENAGREDRPHPILGGMCLKALKDPAPRTAAGKPYSRGDIDYFWSRLEARVEVLPEVLRGDVRRRRPSSRLQREVTSLVGRAGVFTLTGRLRANATYSARHNTIFQGLAADGAKLALWLLWREGYRIVNFVHDQVLVEVPAGSDLGRHARRIRRLMIEGMRAVVPDVLVGVSYAAADRWHKDARAVFDRSGKKLLHWHPEQEEERSRAFTNK